MARRFDVDEFLDDVFFARTPEEVVSVFERLKPLSPVQKADVINELESELVQDIRDDLPNIKMQQDLLRLVAVEDPDAVATDVLLDTFQATMQIYWQVFDVKKEATAPVIKAAVQEASVVPFDQYNSVEGVIRIMDVIIDNAGPPPPPPGSSFGRRGPKF